MNPVPASELPDANAQRTGEIILASRRIEELLRRTAPGDAAGIHQLVEAQNPPLPEALRNKLHYLGSVRNQAAHEAQFQISEDNFSAFRRCAAEVEAELAKRLPPEQPPKQEQDNASGQGKLDVAVEQELLHRWQRRVRLLGFVPVLGALNLFKLFLEVLYHQRGMLLLLLFYLGSLPLIVQGLREDSPAGRNLLYVGFGTFAATVIAAWIVRGFRPLEGWVGVCGLLPGAQIVYLAVLIGSELEWGKLFLALAGLALLGLSGFAAWHEKWEFAGAALFAHWVVSVAGSLLWKEKPRSPESE